MVASPFAFQPISQHNAAVRLLNAHDTGHGMFISHLDRTPVFMKVLTFLPPLSMYLTLAAVMAWRVISSPATYTPVLNFLLNNPQSPEFKWYFTVMYILFDFFLYSHAWPLLEKFATTHFWMRLRHGFRKTEVVFRIPTGTSRLALNGLPPEQAEQAFGAALSRAIDRRFLAENPGFNTRSDFWILNYPASSEAYTLDSHGTLNLKEWDLRVWQKDEGGKWTVWEAFRLHDSETNKLSMEIVKEKLVSDGQKQFVEKWEDLLQQQNKPGASDADKLDIRSAVVYLFKSEGLNLESLWSDAMSEAQQRMISA